MFGEPDDAKGECNARLFMHDNYSDNHRTLRCGLPPGHAGSHLEYIRGGENRIVITWTVDERKQCDHCEQWEHAHEDRYMETCPKFARDHDFLECKACNSARE